MEKHFKKAIIVFITCIALNNPLIHTNTVFIIIHGTWSANSDWYAPGGDFFDTLEKSTPNDTAIVPFRWNGNNNHFERIKAAHSLVKLIQTYDQATTYVYIIAHSHGGNIATLASQILAQDSENNHRVEILYTLGTPTCKEYAPNMNVIGYLYNLFSFEDLIQPVLGAFLREHPSHERIANMRVFINDKEPDHSTLHHPCVAQWLPMLHNDFTQYIDSKNISEPSIVYFDSTKAPQYALDTKRKDLIERDQRISLMIVNSFRNSFEIGSKIPLIKR